MKKSFDELLESGEKFSFNKVNYSDPKRKNYFKEITKEQENVIKEAECTIYEMSQVCFPQFHPFY